MLFVKKQHLLSVPTVLFGLEKASDTCWRQLILREFYNFRMRGKLPLLIVNFLQGRTIRARVGHHLSCVFTQDMGVPKGSVLSVTLFSIFY